VLIHGYMLLTTLSHVGKEGAADFNFWPTKETSLSITLTLNLINQTEKRGILKIQLVGKMVHLR